MDDLISRQEALNIHFSDAINEDGVLYVPLRDFTNGLKELPSTQPEYYDYSDIDDVWEFYAEEQDINLTDGAKQLKDAMWVGYRKGKQDAQPTLYGYNIEHLELIARILQKEDLPPEKIVEILDIGRIIAIAKDEFEEMLKKEVEQWTI